MQRLMVLYYIRSGHLRATAKTIVDAARSVGAVARIKSTRMPFWPYEPGRGSAASREPFFGVGAVVICPLGQGSGLVALGGMTGRQNLQELALGSAVKARATVLLPMSSSNDSPPLTGAEAKVIADPHMKELLSAAVANSKACQNWLSKPKPNLERARVSIAHVIRDVNDLARLFE